MSSRDELADLAAAAVEQLAVDRSVLADCLPAGNLQALNVLQVISDRDAE